MERARERDDEAPRAAVVTGGSRGIGRAIAIALAATGFRVLVVGRDATRLHALCAATPGIEACGADLASASGRAHAAARAVAWSWTLDAAARTLGCSARTLQRQLAARGHRFATQMRASRVAAASALLRDTTLPLADVGYACGCADQAHFQRSFRTVVGMTPAVYRRS